tara:strand:+ start:66 stop:404 length:339 start_codon:yes stop_codon:yes gene_type:complete
MASRYDNRTIAKNSDELYRELFEDRNIRFVRQFRTGTLRHPTVSEITTLELAGHIWSVGDRFYKLAQKHYRDPTYWWVIAWYNQKPTEGHLELGETIQIPTPLERVLGYLDV